VSGSHRRRAVADRLVPWLHRFPAVRALGKRLLSRRVIRQPFHGGVICLDAVEHSWLWTGAIRSETWDYEIQNRLLELSRGCRSMIDVGSNIGLMALSVALRNPDMAVVCVEPSRRAADLLRQSIAANRLGDRVTVLDAVVGVADGVAGFAEDLSTTGHVATSGGLTIPCVDFARLVNQHAADGPCLVKLDVEGYETEVLRALPRISPLSRVRLLVEVHALGFNGFGDPAACSAMLTASGARMTDRHGAPLEAITPWTSDLDTEQIEVRWPASA
jgi:FkbM family methyltransferase